MLNCSPLHCIPLALDRRPSRQDSSSPSQILSAVSLAHPPSLHCAPQALKRLVKGDKLTIWWYLGPPVPPGLLHDARIVCVGLVSRSGRILGMIHSSFASALCAECRTHEFTNPREVDVVFMDQYVAESLKERNQTIMIICCEA